MNTNYSQWMLARHKGQYKKKQHCATVTLPQLHRHFTFANHVPIQNNILSLRRYYCELGNGERKLSLIDVNLMDHLMNITYVSASYKTLKSQSSPFSLDRNRMQLKFRLGHTIFTMAFKLDSNQP